MEKEAVKKHDPYWPKWKYHKSGKSKMIHSKAAEDLLGAEWKDSPAHHGQPSHPYSDEQLAEMAGKQNAEVSELHAHSEHEKEDDPDPNKPRRGRPPKNAG